jgi:hypothetical protein
MSLESVLIMMNARIPERKSTVTSELMIENQWISASSICRYVSQRDAQAMSDGSQITEYDHCTDNVSPFVMFLEFRVNAPLLSCAGDGLMEFLVRTHM